MVAMKGKDCVVVASDTRYGIRNQTIANNFSKIFRMNTQVSFSSSRFFPIRKTEILISTTSSSLISASPASPQIFRLFMRSLDSDFKCIR